MSDTFQLNLCLSCMKELGKNKICPHCKTNQNLIVNPPYALEEGCILQGRYLIGKVLGRGGFGVTYIGYDLVLESRVAVKEYFPQGVATRSETVSTVIWPNTLQGATIKEAGRDSFLSEARKMSKLRNISSIVRVRDTFIANETSYIIMDYVEGQNLKEKVKKEGPMSYEACVRLLKPVMESLSTLHKNGIIHRDISPDNIMERPDGSMCLLDLGAAKDLARQNKEAQSSVVKHGFSPMEQYIKNGEVGPWSDVYALCATIFYCTTGKTIPMAVERIEKEEIDFSKAVLFEPQIKLFQDGLRVKPDERIQSIEELEKRLEECQEEVFREIRKRERKEKLKVAMPYLLLILFFVLGFTALKIAPLLERIGAVSVEMLGHTNANGCRDSNYLIIDEKHDFRIGGDNALYYTNGEQDTYIIQENVKSLCQGADNQVYYITYYVGRSEICSFQVNENGVSEPTTIYAVEDAYMDDLQYAKLSNGEEYLYYLEENALYDFGTSLHRISLRAENGEYISKGISGGAIWFNLYEDSLYVLTNNPFQGLIHNEFLCCTFDGEIKKTLDDESYYTGGFIEDDTMYMWSLKGGIIPCNLNGVKKSVSKKFQDLEIDKTYGVGFSDGWIVFVNRSDGCVYRVQEDGDKLEQIISNQNFASITSNQGKIYFIEKIEEGDMATYKAYSVDVDGKNLKELEGFSKQVKTSLVSNISDFKYELNESGTGIVITRFDPVVGYLKRDLDLKFDLQIPSEIDGLPVLEIGSDAFARDNTIKTVTIPEGIEAIRQWAFAECDGIEEIRLPKSIQEINFSPFESCKNLKTVYISKEFRRDLSSEEVAHLLGVPHSGYIEFY